ncbi:uncharacterized protein [Aegilops tauschii subsp. strangulata]|uniref:uncharacterized protein n=1 Tax=Aegilops tauschii subsp. strangulata TaxID=200361 RepID=UPI000989A949|nr:uncharacterized protein LOC109736287 [Aegilops tauschii subsp. strangulata]XP_020151101.1 uncharacterized protein LOC109736287 [Aegilops tauschii subsp. strangulata]
MRKEAAPEKNGVPNLASAAPLGATTEVAPASNAPETGAASPCDVPQRPSVKRVLACPPLQVRVAEAFLAMTPAGTKEPSLGRALTLVSYRALLRHGALSDAKAALDRLRADFQVAEARLTEERLKFADGWRQLNVTTKMAQRQNEATRAESEKETGEVKSACTTALAEAEAAAKHRKEAEASLKALLDERATQSQQLQSREDDFKEREAKLATRESDLARVSTEKAVERERVETLGR